MNETDLRQFDKSHLKEFLSGAIEKLSVLKDLKPSEEIVGIPDALRMNFNINYTNSHHDEILYLTEDLHVAVLKLDTIKNVAKVVFYKQLDKILDFISTQTSVSYQSSFLISMEPVTKDGVEGYLNEGKSYQIAYISVSARRAFSHVLELAKDPQTGEFTIKVKITTPIMESILKLRYNLKDTQMFSICQETG